MLHAFDDSTGQELWGFIPPDLLTKLHALHEDVMEIFVDGSARAYLTRDAFGSVTKAILLFGERRGGNRYYALDVTDPEIPKYLWEINPDAVGSPYAEMGQTWSTPYIGRIAYGQERNGWLS
jgi:type IV pilus assembly protein PilY1